MSAIDQKQFDSALQKSDAFRKLVELVNNKKPRVSYSQGEGQRCSTASIQDQREYFPTYPAPQIPKVAPTLDGFTQKGQVVVFVSMYHNVHACIRSGYRFLCYEPMEAEERQSKWFALNAALCSSSTLLLALLDSIAVFCARHGEEQRADTSTTYFASYDFSSAGDAFAPLATYSNIIRQLKWKGRSFTELGNMLKHDSAWIGLPSSLDDRIDIYDDDRKPFMHEMLATVYNLAGKMISLLGRRYQVNDIDMISM